jgi:hypothetical protein
MEFIHRSWHEVGFDLFMTNGTEYIFLGCMRIYADET